MTRMPIPTRTMTVRSGASTIWTMPILSEVDSQGRAVINGLEGPGLVPRRPLVPLPDSAEGSGEPRPLLRYFQRVESCEPGSSDGQPLGQPLHDSKRGAVSAADAVWCSTAVLDGKCSTFRHSKAVALTYRASPLWPKRRQSIPVVAVNVAGPPQQRQYVDKSETSFDIACSVHGANLGRTELFVSSEGRPTWQLRRDVRSSVQC